VLGRRHGQERQRPNPYAPSPNAPSRTDQDNVITLPERSSPPGAPASDEAAQPAAVLAQIAVADPNFDAGDFLNGAKSAFTMIVKAFADGDTATLRPLLSDEIYDTFERDIQNRQAAGDMLTTEIHSVAAEIVDARLQDRIAFITVRFTSSQTNVVRKPGGEVAEGDPDSINEVIDIWTFSRDTRSRDPNWLLVETRTP
jgi:predicted lipid-binding transport protein (Tim44 family)